MPVTKAVLIIHEKYIIGSFLSKNFKEELYSYIKERLDDLIDKYSEDKEIKLDIKNKSIFYLSKINNDINVNYIVFYEGIQNDKNRKLYSLFLDEINTEFIDCLKVNKINNLGDYCEKLKKEKKKFNLFDDRFIEINNKFKDNKTQKYKLIQLECNKVRKNLKKNLSLILERDKNLKSINSLSDNLKNNSSEFYKNAKSTFTQKWKILIYKYFNYIIIIIIIFLILI